jgi:release factor glutamine methyltransferase
VTAVSRALARATGQLGGISTTPRLDAELLMAAAFHIGRDRLLLDPPAGPPPPTFDELVLRRVAGEPVAYLTGRRDFWTIELEVGPGALIPRPDSETLMIEAVTYFRGTPGPGRILDLGTGPGTLLLAALDEWPKATGLGVDRSPTALAFARRNAQRLGLLDRADLREGDWAQGIEEAFDLVLANPPYVAASAHLGPGVREYEPAEALFAGDDGLADYRRLAPDLGRLISAGGLAAIEIGADQAETAGTLFRDAGLRPRIAHDLAGRPRALIIGDS